LFERTSCKTLPRCFHGGNFGNFNIDQENSLIYRPEIFTYILNYWEMYPNVNQCPGALVKKTNLEMLH